MVGSGHGRNARRALPHQGIPIDPFGIEVGAGDLDGDSQTDLVVSQDFDASVSWVYYGPRSGWVDHSTADARVYLELGEERMMLGPVDVDADGRADLVYGYPGIDSGEVRTFFGSSL